MSRLERIGFILFMALCFAFLASVLIMVGIISTGELLLSQ